MTKTIILAGALVALALPAIAGQAEDTLNARVTEARFKCDRITERLPSKPGSAKGFVRCANGQTFLIDAPNDTTLIVANCASLKEKLGVDCFKGAGK